MTLKLNQTCRRIFRVPSAGRTLLPFSPPRRARTQQRWREPLAFLGLAFHTRGEHERTTREKASYFPFSAGVSPASEREGECSQGGASRIQGAIAGTAAANQPAYLARSPAFLPRGELWRDLLESCYCCEFRKTRAEEEAEVFFCRFEEWSSTHLSGPKLRMVSGIGGRSSRGRRPATFATSRWACLLCGCVARAHACVIAAGPLCLVACRFHFMSVCTCLNQREEKMFLLPPSLNF